MGVAELKPVAAAGRPLDDADVREVDAASTDAQPNSSAPGYVESTSRRTTPAPVRAERFGTEVPPLKSAGPEAVEKVDEVEGIDPKLELAIRKAVGRLYNYLRGRNSRITNADVILGPNLDECYRWRVDGTGGGDGFGYTTKQIDDQRANALKVGIPDLDELGEDFTNLMYLTNYVARETESRSSGKLVVLKHFPGGEMLELSEYDRHVVDTPYEETMKTFLKPFHMAIDSDLSPRAMMITHSEYPSIHAEMKATYPDLASYHVSHNDDLPATVSPWIVRGLLRKELGYKGMVVSDWMTMIPLYDFINEYDHLPQDSDARMIYFATYAGINWMAGIAPGGMKITASNIEKMCKSDEDFRKVFDDNVEESLYFAVTMADPDKIKFPIALGDLTYDDLHADLDSLPEEKRDMRTALHEYVSKLSMYDKVSLLIRKKGSSRDIKRIVDYYDPPADPWNRMGIIAMTFRKFVVSEMTGREFPDTISTTTERKWLRSLFKNRHFKKAYESIDWNDPRLDTIFRGEIERVLAIR